jgi:bifunctional DNase/RNase/N-acetylglutamate synthase-like GNAT family acetyltransferase
VQVQDLLKVLTALGDLQIIKLVIHDVQDDVYQAKLVVRRQHRIFGVSHEIDCYPSTGFNLAIRTDAPIFVATEVMERAGIRPDKTDDAKGTNNPAIFYQDNDVYIKLADRNDAEIILALSMEVQQMYATALPHLFKTSEDSALSVSDLTELLADTNHHFFIGYEADKAMGYVHAHVVNQPETTSYQARNYIYVYNFMVKEGYRQKGYGKRLLEVVQSLAQDKKLDTIELDVWSFNAEARAFFTKQGFMIQSERLSARVEKKEETNTE